MTVRYPNHLVRTRPQAARLCVMLALVLLPFAVRRGAVQPVGVGMALIVLTAAPFVVAFQCWRFLEAQERVHQEPTPEMMFVFRFLANTPLTFGAVLLVLLAGLE